MDDEKKGLEPVNNPEKTGAGLRVMKQLLRTPAVKDLLVLSTRDSNPEDPRELVKTLMWEDAALSFGLLGSLPRDLNFLIVFLDELGRQIQNVPPDMLREFVSQMGENLDKEVLQALPGAYAPLLDTLIWEDPEAKQHLRDGAVQTLNALMGVFAGTLNKLDAKDDNETPGEETAGEVLNEPAEPDPEVLGELVNALFTWMGNAAGKDPETIHACREKKIKFLQEFMKTTDFGVIRSAVTKRAEANYPVAESLVVNMVSDPIIFANVINILPPIINNVLKGLSAAISNLDFPPEILASAIFNLMDDLDADEIGAIVNGLCLFIGDLHEGNLVLGRDEPRFRPVLQNFAGRMLGDLDEEAVAVAVLALLEDTEVILSVFGDVIAEKPELLEKTFTAVVMGLNAQLRGFVSVAERLSRLSPELYSHFGRELEEKAEFKEAASLINALAKTANQVLDENPALLENIMASFYRSADKEELHKLFQNVAKQSYNFAVKENLIDIKPEEAARITNTLLSSYNRRMIREPQVVQSNISLYMQQVDYEELSQAIYNTSNQISKALEANPRLSKYIMKTVFSFVGGLIRGSLGSKNWNLLSRSAKGQTGKGGGKR